MDWKVTAYTIECPAVAEEVTVTVKNDWTVQCSGFAKYGNSRKANIALLKRSLDMKLNLECKGLNCKQITDYIQKLKDEESLKTTCDGEKK